jgi:hypothetical protein
MGDTKVRYRSIRVADKTDDQKTAIEILNSLVSSISQEDLQEFILSQIKRIIHGNNPGFWRDDFLNQGIKSLEDLTLSDKLVVGVALIGLKDGINRIFTTPDKFIHESGGKSIKVYYNGIVMDPLEDFIIEESNGIGTGFDTIILLRIKAPVVLDSLSADYYKE